MCSTASFGAANSCGTESVMIKSKTKKRTDVCFKCKTGLPFVLIRHGDPFCGPCFDHHLVHKFRQGLGKTKILYPGETVLLNVSGNVSSLAMLNLMATGYDKTSHKKITAFPKILIIDDSCLFDIAESPVPAILRIIEEVPDMPKQTFIIPFELIFLENYQEKCRQFCEDNSTMAVVDLKEMGTDFNGLAEAARSSFRKIKTSSAKEDIHRSLHLQILSTFAEILKSTKVMMSEVSTDLAARLLNTVAVGRGLYVPNETQYLDTRLPGLTFINSMREFTPKECAFYLRRLAISPITIISHSTLSDPIVGSMNRLTDTFISGLQANFPSTVSTVMKTGAKLQTVSNSGANCDVCFLPLPQSGDVVQDLSLFGLEEGLCSGCQIAVSESHESVRGIISRRANTKEILDEFLID